MFNDRSMEQEHKCTLEQEEVEEEEVVVVGRMLGQALGRSSYSDADRLVVVVGLVGLEHREGLVDLACQAYQVVLLLRRVLVVLQVLALRQILGVPLGRGLLGVLELVVVVVEEEVEVVVVVGVVQQLLLQLLLRSHQLLHLLLRME